MYKPAIVAMFAISGSVKPADLAPIVGSQTFILPMKELAAIAGVTSVFGVTRSANPLKTEAKGRKGRYVHLLVCTNASCFRCNGSGRTGCWIGNIDLGVRHTDLGGRWSTTQTDQRDKEQLKPKPER